VFDIMILVHTKEVSEMSNKIIDNGEGYLLLDPEIEAAILDDRAHGRTHAKAARDADVMRRVDLPHDRATLARPAYMRDVEKIVNVPAYNRYAGKTQVFSFVDNDDITRRGLHVQLVDRVARGIGRLLGLNIDLIEAISLGHDVGHTPFGHAGERFLSKCYFERTGRKFNHNVHSVRVLDVLFPRNVSLQTLDGVLCHNGEFACQELMLGDTNTFDKLDAHVEACTIDEREIKHLRPSTLEGCVVRVSDMIAYIGKDRQDALSMGILKDLDAFESRVIGCTNAQIINNLTVDIVNNSYGRDSICMSEEVFEDLKAAKRQNFEIIYNQEGMIDNTSNIVEEMFEEMYSRHLDDLIAGREDSAIFKHHINSLANKSESVTRDQYLKLDPNQIVVDYMASMTDSYFMSLYAHLFPNNKREIPIRDYCASLR
jgi:dGTPase